jgi:hypothetical protein
MINYRPRLIHWVIAAALILLTALPVKANGQEQVTLCHAAGLAGTTHFVTITVGYPAAYGPAGHFNENGTPQAGHEEDYLGPCSSPSPDPTPSPAPTDSFTPSPVPTPVETPETSVAAEPTPASSPVLTRTSTVAPSVPDTAMSQPSKALMAFGILLMLMGIVALSLTKSRR